MSLSIVIPAYQEQHRLGPTLAKIVAWAATREHDVEVIVVDDGSTDRTAAVAEAFGPPVQVLRLECNRGKGAAIRAGVAATSGERVLLCDADLSTPIEELAVLEDELGRGADVVLGSRSVAGAKVQVAQAWYRERLGRGFNLLLHLLGFGGFRDTQCGFKLLRGDAARALFPAVELDGFAFDVELVDLALRRGLTVREVGVVWVNSADSRVDPLRDSMRMLRDVLRLRWRRWRGGSS